MLEGSTSWRRVAEHMDSFILSETQQCHQSHTNAADCQISLMGFSSFRTATPNQSSHPHPLPPSQKHQLSFPLLPPILFRQPLWLSPCLPVALFQNECFSILVLGRMGCQASRLGQQLAAEEGTLEFHKFVERQRGDVLELYHFSKVTSRGSTIVRRVVERSSRVGRVCKILAADRRLNLFRSFQEVEILKHLNHPNVVQIVEYFNQHDFLYIVLEDIPGRTLHQLYLHPDLASLAPILNVLRQLLIALRFCHAAGYAHRAVHPEHVMLVRLERGRLLVKLIGFGQALKIGAPRLQPTAPRDALFAAPDAEAHPEKQDIWGCGVILLQLLSGERKFPDFLLRKDELIQTHVRKLSLEPPQRDCLLDFLQRLLAVSPERRLSAEEALAHPAMGLEVGPRVGTGSGGSEVLEKLLRFRVENNLKSLFSLYASLSILSVEEKSEHLLEFYNLDKNRDGSIDFAELVEGLQNTFAIDYDRAVASVSKIFAQAGKGHHHCLQFHEYVAATTSVTREVYERSLVKMFDELDCNKDGQISPEELGKSIEGVNCGQLLKGLPQKEISFAVFRELMLTIFEQQAQTRE